MASYIHIVSYLFKHNHVQLCRHPFDAGVSIWPLWYFKNTPLTGLLGWRSSQSDFSLISVRRWTFFLWTSHPWKPGTVRICGLSRAWPSKRRSRKTCCVLRCYLESLMLQYLGYRIVKLMLDQSYIYIHTVAGWLLSVLLTHVFQMDRNQLRYPGKQFYVQSMCIFLS